eukprot:TRINITY_DN3105_c0_g1::TRINITY_DN3105_c0_g1_i1::g.3567::m.3567 TRINITY_DN3105_c0_g1::TRINITY_DN3105_c0_g1_i1::g.3567  ORF type:complete len:1863 (+),score=524.64,sp/F1QFR9/PSM4A_DANRE/26.64/9e-42,sp/F1QFR9/PSM4A_DANRE/22.76/2e-37,DUF3437/PF11919.3/46,DUF3437/PF11919.3/7.2e+03,DUF3437/PF11919.3/2.4e-26,HEAT/PF02985.17/1.3e+03,HEAT/PF02985.17/7.4e+03,HEAT/PF02985.17/9,HEAT/PF02985.17/0.064,HEAT_2/PF13646.1/4.9e+03,HEAT_2/PF13646.1/4.8e+03,HEAT_2/PF13646.1/0.05,HEAT_2/PF13646.1/0.014 TRINITY_DN3105_
MKRCIPKFRNISSVGFCAEFQATEKLVEAAWKARRHYGGVNTAEELMQELTPRLGPHGESAYISATLLALFYPTNLGYDMSMSEGDLSTYLGKTVDRLVAIWWSDGAFDGDSVWDTCFASILHRIAKHPLGSQLNWEPHLPFIMTRLLFLMGTSSSKDSGHSDQSKQGAGYLRALRKQNPVQEITALVANVMGSRNPSALTHLAQFIKAIDIFANPSNIGPWSGPLQGFLTALPEHLCKRVGRSSTPFAGKVALSEDELRQVAEHLNVVFTPCILSKDPNVVLATVSAVRSMATLAPQSVLPKVLEDVEIAFATLTQPHRLLSTLETLAAVGRILLDPAKFPDGMMVLRPLLEVIPAAIDVNDLRKTFAVLKLLQNICSTPAMATLFSEDPNIAEEFVLAVLDRIFAFLPHVDKPSSNAMAQDSLMLIVLYKCVSQLVAAVPDRARDSIIKKYQSFISTQYGECKNAVQHVASITSALASVVPEKVLQAVLKVGRGQILEETPQPVNGVQPKPPVADDVIEWVLRVTRAAVKYGGKAILQHEQELVRLVKVTLVVEKPAIHKRAAMLLRGMLSGLTRTYIHNIGLAAGQYSWHEPSADEEMCASRIAMQFVPDTMQALRDFALPNSTVDVSPLRNVILLMNILRGLSSYLPLEECPKASYPRVKIGAKNVSDNLRNFRAECADVLVQTLDAVMARRGGDTKALNRLAQAMETLLVQKGFSRNTLQFHGFVYSIYKSARTDKSLPRGHRHVALPNWMNAERSLLLYVSHIESVRLARTPYFTNVLNALLKLSTESPYSKARTAGQGSFCACVRAFPGMTREYLPVVMDKFEGKPVSKREISTGSLYLLVAKPFFRILSDDIAFSSRFMELLCTWNGEGANEPNSITRLSFAFSLFSSFLVLPSVHTSDKQDIEALERVLNRLLQLAQNAKKDNESLHWRTELAVVTFLTAIACKTNMSRRAELENVLFDALGTCSHPILPLVLATVSTYAMGLEPKVGRKGVTRDPSVRWDDVASLRATDGSPVWVDDSWLGWSRDLPPGLCAYSHHDGVDYSPSGVFAALMQDEAMLGKLVDRLSLTHQEDSDQARGRHGAGRSSKIDFFTQVLKPVTTGISSGFKCLGVSSPHALTQPRFAPFSHFLSAKISSARGWPSSRSELPASSTFHVLNAQFFKGVARSHGPRALLALQPHVERLLTTTTNDLGTERTRVATVAEILSGLVRGSKFWDTPSLQALWNWVLSITQRCLDNPSIECTDEFALAVIFMTNKRDPRRFTPLTDHILNTLSRLDQASAGAASAAPVTQASADAAPTVSSTLHNRYLILASALLSEGGWRMPDTFRKAMYSHLLTIRAHPYKQIRQRAGRLMILLAAPLMRSQGSPRPDSDTAMDIDTPPNASSEPSLHSMFAEYTAGTEHRVEDDAKEKESTSAGAVAGGESEETKRVRRLRETIIIACHMASLTGYGHILSSPEVAPSVVRAVMSACADSDNEIADIAFSTVALLGQGPIHPMHVENTLLPTLEGLTASPSWRIRRAVLPVIAFAVFRWSLWLSDSVKTRAVNDIKAMLKDDQIEVRDHACQSLVTLVRVMPPELVQTLCSDFRKDARTTKLPPKKTAGTTISPEDDKKNAAAVIKRHAAVLGLSAFVLAHPYSIPSYLPDILVALAAHRDDPLPMKKTVQRAFGEFWRTHIDQWDETYRMKFSEDQLDTINGTRQTNLTYFG